MAVEKNAGRRPGGADVQTCMHNVTDHSCMCMLPLCFALALVVLLTVNNSLAYRYVALFRHAEPVLQSMPRWLTYNVHLSLRESSPMNMAQKSAASTVYVCFLPSRQETFVPSKTPPVVEIFLKPPCVNNMATCRLASTVFAKLSQQNWFSSARNLRK
jgi:hypothetical protein